MQFVELVGAVHSALREAKIPHAFGGALALGYVAAPRGTVDIDVNVFVGIPEMERVAAAVSPLGFSSAAGPTDPPIAGIRFVHPGEPFPIDFFPSLDPAYEEIADRVVRHEFGRGGATLPFLSAEDLCVFKLSFGRPQDWVDLAAVAVAKPDLDLVYVERQVVALRGPTMYPRVARLRSLFP